jgi:hypothetical protein
MKRLSSEAYQALRDALSVVTWNKRPFETLLQTALRDHSELLAGLTFSEPKRRVADQLVDRLVRCEHRYQDVALRLMLELASMTTFTNIEQIKDPEDRALRLREAATAVERLRALTARCAGQVAAGEKAEARREPTRAQAEAARRFEDEVTGLRQVFLRLQAQADVRARGHAFEALLRDLFRLFDMEPRLAYTLDREQVDGSLSFDTDDYIVEARWRRELVDRGDADIFATKFRRKGKNALGLLVSVNGFTAAALDQYKEATPFVALDGRDLYTVPEGRVRLDDLLRAKRRHANETGACYLPVTALL